MSFQLTLSNIPDKDLGPLIARMNLPRGVTVEHKYVVDVAGFIEGPKKGRHRVPRDTKLTMTGKRPQQGSKINDVEHKVDYG